MYNVWMVCVRFLATSHFRVPPKRESHTSVSGEEGMKFPETFRDCAKAGDDLARWANAVMNYGAHDLSMLLPEGWAFRPFESCALTEGVFARAWVIAPGPGLQTTRAPVVFGWHDTNRPVYDPSLISLLVERAVDSCFAVGCAPRK